MEATVQTTESRNDEGRRFGAEWAKTAPREYLERLRDVRDQAVMMGEWDHYFGADGIDCVWTPGELFHHAIEGGDEEYGNPDRTEAAEFWDQAGFESDDTADSDFIRGFADGAVEVQS